MTRGQLTDRPRATQVKVKENLNFGIAYGPTGAALPPFIQLTISYKAEMATQVLFAIGAIHLAGG
jgi:hypothetical protein